MEKNQYFSVRFAEYEAEESGYAAVEGLGGQLDALFVV